MVSSSSLRLRKRSPSKTNSQQIDKDFCYDDSSKTEPISFPPQPFGDSGGGEESVETEPLRSSFSQTDLPETAPAPVFGDDHCSLKHRNKTDTPSRAHADLPKTYSIDEGSSCCTPTSRCSLPLSSCEEMSSTSIFRVGSTDSCCSDLTDGTGSLLNVSMSSGESSDALSTLGDSCHSSSSARSGAKSLLSSGISSYASSLTGHSRKKRLSKLEKVYELMEKNRKLTEKHMQLKYKIRETSNKISEVVNSTTCKIHSLEVQLQDTVRGTQDHARGQTQEMDKKLNAIKALGDMILILKERLYKQKKELSRAVKEQEGLGKRCEQMKKERSKVQLDAGRLEKEIGAAVSETHGLRKEFGLALEESKKLEGIIRESEIKVQNLNKVLADARTKKEMLEQGTIEKTAQIDRCEDDVSKKCSEIKQLEEDVKVKEAYASKLEKVVDNTRKRLADAEEKCNSERLGKENTYSSALSELEMATQPEDTVEGSKRPGRRIRGFLKKRRSKVKSQQRNSWPQEQPSTQNKNLERIIEEDEETIAQARQELLQLNASYKEDKYRNNALIAKLREENLSYVEKMKALEEFCDTCKENTNSRNVQFEEKSQFTLKGETSSRQGNKEREKKEDSDQSSTMDRGNEIHQMEERIEVLNKEVNLLKSTMDDRHLDLAKLQTQSKATTHVSHETECEPFSSNELSGSNTVAGNVNSDDAKKNVVLEQLQRTNTVHEQTVDSLHSDIINLRNKLKSDASMHQKQKQGLQDQIAVNSIKAAVFEKEFLLLNGRGEEEREGIIDDSKCDIVALDASLVLEMIAQLAQNKEKIQELDREVADERSITNGLHADLRSKVDDLKKERDAMLSKTVSHIPCIAEEPSVSSDDSKRVVSEESLNYSQGKSLLNRPQNEDEPVLTPLEPLVCATSKDMITCQ